MSAMFFKKSWTSIQPQEVEPIWPKSIMVISFPLQMITLEMNMCCKVANRKKRETSEE